MKAQRSEVYAAIDGERDYQDRHEICRENRDSKSVGDYLTLIRVYSAKADVAYYDNIGDSAALDVLRKIAAIAVLCMEDHGAPRRHLKSGSGHEGPTWVNPEVLR